MNDFGIVEIFLEEYKEKSKCGYCKNQKSSMSYGMWAHRLTVNNYQDLTVRGWRRSGLYCYKPNLKETCCPLYTIRCDAPQFRLSKSQKSTLRRMRQFLINGEIKSGHQEAKSSNNESEEKIVDEEEQMSIAASRVKGDPKQFDSVRGADPNRPRCKKAKVIRMEKKLAKINQSDVPQKTEKSKSQNQPKSLRDYVEEPLPPNAKHKLEVITVRPKKSDKKFRESFGAVCDLYKKYQLTVHNDKPQHCTPSQFQRFLTDSPLIDEENEEGTIDYGSFHQQYWLDDKLIAVGVIDILPKFVSSVYFFYDPDYSFLSLGNYGALREILFTQELNAIQSELQYYLMGFYIHSCVKMRYKGQYQPSFLLCPETFTWQPIEDAKKKLELNKYARLNDDLSIVDDEGNVEDNSITILHKESIITFTQYANMKNVEENEKRNIHHYAKLAGKKAAKNILLFRL